MGKTLIKVDCVDQRLLVSSGPIIASGGRNEDEIEFSFCPLWDGFEKTAVFHREKDRAYHAVITDDRCVIPHEVLIDEGWMYFGVMGVKGDITRTSEILKYRITEGAITEGTKPSDPTPNIYEQILAQLFTVNNRLDQIGGASLDPQPFEVTGKLVQLDNFEGMPLNCVTRIEPVQAGSGDPYPGGGGKNLLNPKLVGGNEAYASVTSDGRWRINNTSGGAIYLANEWVNLPVGNYCFQTDSNVPNLLVYIQKNSDDYSVYISDGIQTKTVYVSDGEQIRVLCVVPAGTSTTVSIWAAKGANSTHYAPYANIRPISGHTGAKLTRCGKNLAEQIVYGYVTLDGNNAYVRIDNNSTAVIAGVVEGNEYTISCNATFDRFGVGKLETANPANGATLTDYRFYGNQSSVNKLHFTAEFTGNAFIYLKSTKDETAKDSLQVEIGSVATEYEPYQGNDTFSASFGQTVYGGTLDWNKGVLTVDRAVESLTSAKVNSVTDAGTSTQMFVVGINNASFDGHTINDAPVSSHYTGVKWYSNPWNVNNSISYYSQYNLRVRDSRFGSIANYGAYLNAQNAAGTPVQVCYKLATPTTIQLTPAQLTALQGMNNIFCDAGETTVSGRKDILWLTSHLIERINALESAIISTGGNV